MRLGHPLSLAALLAVANVACAGPPEVTLPPNPTCSASLPLQFTRGLPLVSIDVNGFTVSVLLDSGGFDSVSLGALVIDQVKPAYTGKTQRFENARGDALVARGYRLERVAIGPHVFTDVHGSEYVFAPDLPPTVLTGYLGLGLLRHLHLLIDYGRGELGLADRRCPVPALPDGAPWQRVKIESDEDGPRISATIDGRRRSLVLDTGASYSTIRRDVVPQQRLRRVGTWELYPPARVIAGDGEITGLELAVVDLRGPGTDGILGCNFFAAYQVFMDFEHREIAFRRSPLPVPHPCPSPTED
jgi:hypothetical protein